MNIILIPKAVYRFSIIPKKILISFFIEIEIKNLKFMWNPNRSQIAKTILSKKKNAFFFLRYVTNHGNKAI